MVRGEKMGVMVASGITLCMWTRGNATEGQFLRLTSTTQPAILCCVYTTPVWRQTVNSIWCRVKSCCLGQYSFSITGHHETGKVTFNTHIINTCKTDKYDCLPLSVDVTNWHYYAKMFKNCCVPQQL